VAAAADLARAPARSGEEDGVTRLLAGLAFLGLNFYTYYYFATAEVHPERTSLASFPLQLGDWVCPQRESMGRDVERNLGVTDYLVCVFQRAADRELVSLYVGYHASQVRKEGGGSEETMIHPPAHCLPGSGWDIIDLRRVPIDLPGLPGAPTPVNRLVIAKGDERQLVYYWYQERGRVIAQDWRKIVALFADRATRQRTDGALVRITAPIVRGDEARSERAIMDLAAQIAPRLPAFVPN
jgi:EpsI family protein